MKMEKNYIIPWGTITVRDDGSYFICPNFGQSIWKWVEGSAVFEEEGHYGCIKEGTVVCPPIFDQVEFIHEGNTLYLRRGNMYSTFSNNGRYYMGETIAEEEGEFVEDGKMGWRRGDRVLIPALYDDIIKWYGLDVFQVKTDGGVRCLNSAGEEILTYIRKVDAEDKQIAPFNQVINHGDVFTLLEYPASSVVPSSNVVTTSEGFKASLDRVTRKELMEELICPDDDLALREDLSLFNNDFSYEYASYRFKVRTDRLYRDLMDCFSKFDVQSNSWHYVMRITSPAGENIPAGELRKLRHLFEGPNIHWLGCHFAVGHAGYLDPGTASVLVITHYHERCWPAHFEFEWLDNCEECSLEELKEKEVEMKKAVDEVVLDQYKDEVLADQYRAAFANVSFDRGRSWEESKKVYDYLAEKTDCYLKKLGHYCIDLRDAESLDEKECFFSLVKWALEKGAKVNCVGAGSTELDVIDQGIKRSVSKEEVSVLNRARTLLESYGAKTYHQILEEEKVRGVDYREELELLRRL